jgi:hypothetical protein
MDRARHAQHPIRPHNAPEDTGARALALALPGPARSLPLLATQRRGREFRLHLPRPALAPPGPPPSACAHPPQPAPPPRATRAHTSSLACCPLSFVRSLYFLLSFSISPSLPQAPSLSAPAVRRQALQLSWPGHAFSGLSPIERERETDRDQGSRLSHVTLSISQSPTLPNPHRLSNLSILSPA